MASSTRDDVLRLVSEVLEQPLSSLKPSDHFIDDLGASSLDIVTLVMRIEQHYALGETPDSQLEHIETIGHLIDLVDAHRGVGLGGEISEGLSPVIPQQLDVVIASDHAAVGLKSELVHWMRQRGWQVLDLGPSEGVSVDYPDFALMVGQKITSRESPCGILLCGTGIGMSIAANKIAGVRAALVSSALEARLAREHNDANVLCIGARMIGSLAAQSCVEAFLSTAFTPGDDGRHLRRIQMLEALRSRA